jgi:hypothetical protein
MSSKFSFLRTTALLTCLLYGSGMVLFPLVPKAHALYWEDDYDGNDPHEVKTRPNHFSLFDWVDDAQNDAKKREYRKIDNHDKGPGVNGAAKATVVILSGVIGLGAGLFAAYEFTPSGNDLSEPMMVGGSLGLVTGVAIGALIMPRDYEVNPQAFNDFMKQRQAWMEDPIRLQLQSSFRPSLTSVSFAF